MSQPYTASTRSIHLWASGWIGWMLTYTLGSLMMNIFNTGYGLSPVLVSWAVTLPRLFDTFIDPVIAHMSDNTHSRWGRRKPFMVIGGLGSALSVMLVWWISPTWCWQLQFVCLTLGATLVNFMLGTYGMAHTSLGCELTDDYHQRTRVMAARSLYGTLASVASGWVYWLALRPMFGGEISGIRWVSGVMAVVIGVFTMTSILGSKERFQKSNRDHVKLSTALKATMSNRPFMILLFMQLTQGVGGAVFWGLFFYVNTYYVCRGDKALSTQLGGILATSGAVIGVATLFFMTRISKLVGKRNGVIMGAATTALGALLVPFLLIPGHPYWQIWIWCGLGPLACAGTTLTAAILPDICDVDELETGHRREGLFGAAGGFFIKLEGTICGLLVGYLVKFAGIDPSAAVQTAETISRLKLVAYIPYVLFSVAAVALAWRFPITEAMMADVRVRLDERRAAAAKVASNEDSVPVATARAALDPA